MKKMPNDPDLLEEYDFSAGVKGKYAAQYAEGTNVVVVDPDVAPFFPDHDSVNEALRHLAAIIMSQKKAEKQGCRQVKQAPPIVLGTQSRARPVRGRRILLRNRISSREAHGLGSENGK
ncbi:MAG: hypothetical protein BWX80_02510 [Candidatus Hydrogenedentes bacterium ADurb.Bin101]|nr:MAG: hypothetical protein BWX80_02510 [Candidatus Hydrogenedentes bacterium ADurb.Bin101]